MITFTKRDLDVRIQLSACAYADMVSDYIDALKLGKRNVKTIHNKLIVLDSYIQMLIAFDVCSACCTEVCITDEQALQVSDVLSKLTDVCFQPPGFDYEVPAGLANMGIGAMQIGCTFVVS